MHSGLKPIQRHFGRAQLCCGARHATPARAKVSPTQLQQQRPPVPTIVCRFCGTKNALAGQCIECRRNLGRLDLALLYGGLTATSVALLWYGFTIWTAWGFTLFAAVVGIIVSGSILGFAHGRGPIFQLIASSFTILAITIGEGLVGRAVPGQFFLETGGQQLPATLMETAWVMAMWDPWTFACMIVGVAGGMFIWKYN